MNNIYAKTVHKEYITPYELHPITASRGKDVSRKISMGGPTEK